MKTAEGNCGHFLVKSHQMCHAGENLGMERCDLLMSYSWSSTESNLYTVASLGMFLKLPPFSAVLLPKTFRGYIISSVWLQALLAPIGMFSIAWACPLYNCSHLGKAVIKPSAVLESSDLLHNSAPKFGLSFTGLLHLLMNMNQLSTPLKTLIGPSHT